MLIIFTKQFKLQINLAKFNIMENKLFTIVNKADEASFLADLNANPDNFKKKVIFVFSDSGNYIVINGEKFLS